MCSIYGMMFFEPVHPDTLKAKMEKMAEVSQHRGPDQSEIVVLDQVAIGMNRLSIISPEENSTVQKDRYQKRYAVLNGEIVNYRKLQGMLANKPTQNCDSAVILPLYEEYGRDFITKLAGMFAISIYDEKSGTLQLWRDPLGIKPLYYYFSNECVIFASEIKMIYAVMDEKPMVEFSAVDHILRYRLHPSSTTAFKGICKVLPGETIVVKDRKLTKERYWSLQPNQNVYDDKYGIEQFRELFIQVIRENCYADVPGGFFTSGGLDSSLVTAVALREKMSSYQQPISIRFSPNSVIDEKYGAVLEAYLGKKFEWVTITDELARQTLWDLSHYLDEPLENPIHVGTYLMAKRAKEMGLKSVLTGDGSDEFFLGYERHAIWFNHPNPAAGYSALHWTMRPEDATQLYKPHSKALVKTMVNGDNQSIEPFRDMTHALLYERGERLPEYHNMRLDRMTMAHGIEAKVPFLDHRIVEFSLNIPTNKLIGIEGKEWLKNVASKWLPSDLIHRQKVLFPSLPNQWLSGKGGEWAASILLDSSAKVTDYLERSVMEQYMKQHMTGEVERGKLLWALLSLELWFQNISGWGKSNSYTPINLHYH
ncbi:asparagine synthase (glutamine-hydrolyzing) [Paenibacillus ferrarius]|uniref:asparagine synthase (glutamine-hydrolyzing) n=1 Tax=Paenibacillus ferrarius TaxID=1469647 RepID=A0A1V4HAZ6_9BACL|nr:asparagine synthase (glutamine-hydrolyzing) [Paenibacillus ferrarius]OPH47987.1 asparagine synthase (glutamine-hydrolyzing) [Paenibacillus ferrarius]